MLQKFKNTFFLGDHDMKRVTVLAGVVAVLFAGPILLAAEPASESEEASEMSMQKMHKMMNMNNMEMEAEGSQNMADDMPCQRMDAMQDQHHDMQDQHHDMQGHKQMMQKMKEHMAEHQSTQEEPDE